MKPSGFIGIKTRGVAKNQHLTSWWAIKPTKHVRNMYRPGICIVIA